MSKQSLLLVDGDARSMRVLEVSLRKAGFTVTTAATVQDALDKLELDAPDLIISETTFVDGDGFELRRRVRETTEWGEIPFIFLTGESAIENKIRGLELGVDDYLTKPIYIKEIVTRINILLQKRQRVRFEERRDGRTRFAGRVADMPVVDVIQTIEISRKSGVIQFVGERGRQAAIYFRDGRVIDAEAGALQGEDAVYRLLTWSEGEFEVVFRTVRRREAIATSSQGLLMEGMRRLDEWSHLLEQLPPLTHRFEVDAVELSVRLGDIPDDNNAILRLIDGKRTLLEVIDSSDVGDLECLQAISRLYFEEMLIDLDQGAPVKRDTGRSMPLVEVDTPPPLGDGSTDLFALDLNDDSGVAEPPGELLGGYRQSSLMLIEAAVAAAQAIEPALFDDQVEALVNAERAPGGRVPVVRASPATESERLPARELEAEDATDDAEVDDSSEPVFEYASEPPDVQVPSRFDDSVPHPIELEEPPAAADESGLRMIGSLGRDRAEASGELVPLGSRSLPQRSETQRELVTILPRRITRESTAVTDSTLSEPARPRLPSPVAAPPVAEPEPPTSPMSPRLTRRTPSVPPPRAAEGTGVRKSTGPGIGALVLLGLAAILTVVAVGLYLSRGSKSKAHPQPPPGSEQSGPDQPTSRVIMNVGSDSPPRDAAMPWAHTGDAGVANVPAPSDAAITVAVALDAGVAVALDAGVAVAVALDASVDARVSAADMVKQARLFMEQASTALTAREFPAAIKLAEASLRLRKTARAFLVKAQALQGLGQVEEALAAIAAAEALTKDAPFPFVYELRARVLRAARRKDEARAPMERYLQLAPNGDSAPEFKRWLHEPQ